MGAGQSLYTQPDTKYALHTLQRCETPYICDPDRVSVPQPITIYERPLAGAMGEGATGFPGSSELRPATCGHGAGTRRGCSPPTLHNELSVFYELKCVTPAALPKAKCVPV